MNPPPTLHRTWQRKHKHWLVVLGPIHTRISRACHTERTTLTIQGGVTSKYLGPPDLRLTLAMLAKLRREQRVIPYLRLPQIL